MIPGGLEITENDLIYVNSSVIVSIGDSKEGFNPTEFILVLPPFLMYEIYGLEKTVKSYLLQIASFRNSPSLVFI